MAQSFNRVELIGRLGNDPVTRFTGNDVPVASFRLATDRPARGGGQSETDWHTIVCWEKRAAFAEQYLTRGRLVFVAGRLAYRNYEQEGQRRTTVEIVAAEIIPLDSRPSGPASAEPGGDDLDAGDVPF